MSRPLASIILAAGKGTRMHSQVPKVLHRILGRPLVSFPVQLATELGANPVVAVLGHGADAVRAVLPEGIESVLQPEQRGTADAVRVGLAALGEFEGAVLVLSGDVPLLTRETVERLLRSGRDAGATARGDAGDTARGDAGDTGSPGVVGMVTAQAPDPTGYGRVVRGRDGRVERVVEERDATAEQRTLSEVNAGIYRFEASFLRSTLGRLGSDNAQRELYLTDLIEMAARGGGVSTISADWSEVAGVNDRRDLAMVETVLRARVNERHQLAGVSLSNPASISIDLAVTIGKDVSIEPGCVLTGNTTIADGAVIRAHSLLEDAVVGPGCVIGPFARLRKGTDLAANVHIGNFVELKNARVGEGSKANHHSYLGDVEIGRQVNVGAGTITCNYDGEKKSLTRLGDGVFIGSDSQLVAPVSVGAGAYVGAGTTVQEDVPEDSLVFTRAPRVVKEGWAKRRREKSPAKPSGKIKG